MLGRGAFIGRLVGAATGAEEPEEGKAGNFLIWCLVPCGPATWCSSSIPGEERKLRWYATLLAIQLLCKVSIAAYWPDLL